METIKNRLYFTIKCFGKRAIRIFGLQSFHHRVVNKTVSFIGKVANSQNASEKLFHIFDNQILQICTHFLYLGRLPASVCIKAKTKAKL